MRPQQRGICWVHIHIEPKELFCICAFRFSGQEAGFFCFFFFFLLFFSPFFLFGVWGGARLVWGWKVGYIIFWVIGDSFFVEQNGLLSLDWSFEDDLLNWSIARSLSSLVVCILWLFLLLAIYWSCYISDSLYVTCKGIQRHLPLLLPHFFLTQTTMETESAYILNIAFFLSEMKSFLNNSSTQYQ